MDAAKYNLCWTRNESIEVECSACERSLNPFGDVTTLAEAIRLAEAHALVCVPVTAEELARRALAAQAANERLLNFQV